MPGVSFGSCWPSTIRSVTSARWASALVSGLSPASSQRTLTPSLPASDITRSNKARASVRRSRSILSRTDGAYRPLPSASIGGTVNGAGVTA